ncbi:MAG: transglutaminaseTgpA domain-containing protein [Actinomycetota bacterium]|nr:transglutaminaseTgpA domain-containing protein [Actinomycetota bacterium]
MRGRRAGTAPLTSTLAALPTVPARAAAGGASRSRVKGLSHGASAFLFAWPATLAIALLTGAGAVVILLAVEVVAAVAAGLGGWVATRRVLPVAVETRTLATVGDELTWHVQVREPAHGSGRDRAFAELRVADGVVADGWVGEGGNMLTGTAPRRGEHPAVEVRWKAAGRLGLVWWQRSIHLTITPLAIAPRAATEAATLRRTDDETAGDHLTQHLPGRDQVDGVRAWREGDDLDSVHWPSTLRSGEFIVRQRLRDRSEHWLVHARTGTGDADGEAGRVLHTVQRGFAAGARVAAQADDGDPHPLPDLPAAQLWCARFEPPVPAPAGLPWWRRPIGWASPEPERRLRPAARWAAGAAVAVPLVMMLQPLGYQTAQILTVVAALAMGAAVSAHLPPPRVLLRQLAALATAAAVAASLIDIEAIDGVPAALRFLLPQVLVTLVVLQGFECTDRRSARVTIACAAVLTAYGAGIRVDPQLAAWLLASCAATGVATLAVVWPDRTSPRPAAPVTAAAASVAVRRQQARGVATGVLAVAGAAMAVLALLAVIPVPRGPAQLTLPSWLQEQRPTGGGGQLAAPDGSPLLGGASATTRNGADGSVAGGGYPGFSPTMDTSLRGALGDEVVLRVRSPYPDFWRGQTFSEFDGRSWTVDPDTGVRTEGPDHQLLLASGDVAASDDVDELIQTFYAEVDLPNIVFAANRPTRVLLDAPIWQRPDGALRADVVLPAGSAYTVVSQRSGATAQLLRLEGDVTRWQPPARYTALPASFTERTAELARELAAGQANTFDVVQAIELWLADHVEYDLFAPVPPAGTDAVDHFLFQSQRGFCEQIATATAMMLRSLGIPARVATGYVPSDRDEVAGVWISRARDAHAWVEVRFPSFGWVAFDPTASVPLAGEASLATIGGELVRALSQWFGDHLAIALLTVLAGAVLLGVARFVRRAWRRHRRGRWGVLQDRFVAAALRRGASSTAPNAELAAVFDPTAAPEAGQLAATLDASAFSATWTDDDLAYAAATTTLRTLEHPHPPRT